MPRRPRLSDIAREAGVSLATVDRVLNGREAVRPETARAVAAAAARLGLGLPGAPTVAADQPLRRIGVLLHKGGQEFYQAFSQELALAVAEASGIRGELVLEFAASQAPSEVASRMRSLGARVDVLAATAVNHPEITAAVTDLRDRGVPVFALLSDFAQGVRAGYVGLNNLKVGRVAGWMVALSAGNRVQLPGQVAVFVGGHRWHGHELRETGFRAYLREAGPGLEVLDTIVNLETRSLAYEATLTLLARRPGVRALFVAGGGKEGTIAALREVRAPGEVVLVVNELTPETRVALAEGWVTLVIGTPLAALCRDLVGLMAGAAVSAQGGGQFFLTPDLHVAEAL